MPWRMSTARLFSGPNPPGDRHESTRLAAPRSIRRTRIAGHLLVQPDVLEARPVVDAVDHLGHPLHPRPVADRGAWVEEDRPDVILDQLPFDVPYQASPLLRVRLHRLLVDQRIDRTVTVPSIVARGV